MADITNYSPDYTGRCFSGERQDADLEMGLEVMSKQWLSMGIPFTPSPLDQQFLGKVTFTFDRDCS